MLDATIICYVIICSRDPLFPSAAYSIFYIQTSNNKKSNKMQAGQYNELYKYRGVSDAARFGDII